MGGSSSERNRSARNAHFLYHSVEYQTRRGPHAVQGIPSKIPCPGACLLHFAQSNREQFCPRENCSLVSWGLRLPVGVRYMIGTLSLCSSTFLTSQFQRIAEWQQVRHLIAMPCPDCPQILPAGGSYGSSDIQSFCPSSGVFFQFTSGITADRKQNIIRSGNNC